MDQKEKKGVCGSCQSIGPVRMSRADPEEHDMDMDDELTNFGDPRLTIYVMDYHEFCGTRCEGIGTVPQFILKD